MTTEKGSTVNADLNNALRKAMVTAFAAATEAFDNNDTEKAEQYENYAARISRMRTALNRKPREKK